MVNQEIKTNPLFLYQEKVWNQLKHISESEKIANAYLFFGPPGCGKEGMAVKFAQLLNCEDELNHICENCPSCKRCQKLQHENIKLIFPLPKPKKSIDNNPIGNNTKQLDLVNNAINQKSQDLFFKIRIPNANRILIQSIRDLRKTLFLKSESSGKQVVIIFDSHLLSSGQGEAANALLKLLEEPPIGTTFILVTDHINSVFQTIISRCQKIGFPKLQDKDIESWFKTKNVEEAHISLLVGLSRGNLQSAKFFVTQSVQNLMLLISNLVIKTTKSNPNDWRKFIEEYSKLAKQDSEKFVNHFLLLKIWYQSVNRLKNKINDPLHHTDLKEEMENLIRLYPSAELLLIVIELEKIVRAIQLNLYMPLVLINFLLKVQEYLNHE